MNKNLSDVTVVIDRSGSMVSCKEEAENGLNQFIKDQKDQDGKCLFTLVQFDTQYEFVHKGELVQNVGKFELIPRGMTALLDAVGRAINETGERLAKMPETQRPGVVIFVILTDGYENASSEFTRKQIKDMITHQREKYNWQFTYLGANQDAFAEAEGYGIKIETTSNFSADKTDVAFASASNLVTNMRAQAASGVAVEWAYSAEERSKMEQ